MSNVFLVVSEIRDGKLRQVSLEALSAAARCAAPGDTVAAAVVGCGDGLLAATDDLAAYGAERIYVVDHPDLANYRAEAYGAALLQVVKQANPGMIMLGHTSIGRDLAPWLASALDAGQIADVTAIEQEGDALLFTRPIYAGKAFEKKRFAGGGGTQVVTIRPNNLPLAEPDPGRLKEMIEVEYGTPTLRTLVREVVKKTAGKTDLAEAKFIVSGGRGVKSADGFKPLEELAEALGGAVGASRGACDAGYCDYGLQIGQTGKMVTPEIYIACGISGAIQHLAGMSGSRVIIAINTDPEAPIFKVADYGIVGDLFEVVPLLTQEFRRALGK